MLIREPTKAFALSSYYWLGQPAQDYVFWKMATSGAANRCRDDYDKRPPAPLGE